MERDTFEKFYPKIYNYAYYRTLNKADAEDITYVKADGGERLARQK